MLSPETNIKQVGKTKLTHHKSLYSFYNLFQKEVLNKLTYRSEDIIIFGETFKLKTEKG